VPQGATPGGAVATVGRVLIAEELLLLALDDTTGRRLVGTDRLDPTLGGALVAELALAERIGVTGEEEGWSRRGRLTITDPRPTDDPELDRALQAVVAAEGRKVKDLLSGMSSRRITKGLRDRLAERLARAGALERVEEKVLGLFPWTTWPARDRAPEDEVRRRLHGALVAGTTPAERTVVLVALLQVAGLLSKVLPDQDRRLIQRRAKELSEGDWVAKAVKQALDEVAAATTAAAVGGAGGS
jgi:hypothetical protein